MEYIVINGLQPWDGRYEFTFVSELTTREWGWIKRHAGYMPLTVMEGLEGGDPELFAIFAVIAIRRAGRIQPEEVTGLYERFGDATFGSTITIESDGEPAEDDAGPPVSSSNGNTGSSGDGSPTSSETSEPTPPASGTPASASSPSAPVMWAT